MLAAVLVSAGLALVLALLLAFLACSRGLLFSGLDTLFCVVVTTAFCAFVVPVTALVFRRKQRHFAWHTLCIEALVLALVAVGLLSWLQTRQHLRIFMQPAPVPNGVQVRQGRSILFSTYVHFSATPEAIASVIQSKALLEVSAVMPDKSDITDFSSRERTKVSWGWWQPATMSSPKFFFRHHASEAVQGWCEGWWVNGATNEVYAFISG
jgi:hypothetical protein